MVEPQHKLEMFHHETTAAEQGAQQPGVAALAHSSPSMAALPPRPPAPSEGEFTAHESEVRRKQAMGMP